jgi:di/tricarboxylate transporter
MNWQAWVTLAVIIGTIYLLMRDVVAPAIAVLGSVITLLTLGIITPAQAFGGFSNAAPITVAALYVVARAVEKTAALQPILQGTLGRAKQHRAGLARLLFPVAGSSAFLNNTPIVAMLIPQVSEWAERRQKPVSWFLMPLSFAAILGGCITLIGTSTNLVVAGLMQDAGHAPLGMFELTPIGLPLALAGVLFLVLFAPILLPDRRPPRESYEEELRQFVIRMRVQERGGLGGRTVEEAGLRHLQGVFLGEIEREGQAIAPVGPEAVLADGDLLTFAGRVDLVLDLQNTRGLAAAESVHAADFDGTNHTFFEAVVSEASPLAGRTLREVNFREHYQAAVLAIHRAGERVAEKLGTVRLRAGDTLLLLADNGFRRRWRDRSDFLLVSRLGGSLPVGSRKAWLVGAITAAIVILAGTGLIPILQSALLGAIALVVLGVLSPQEAKASVDLDVIVVIAAAFGLGAAMTASGLAEVIANGLIAVFSGWGGLGVLLGVVVATALFTEIITNNAAAVLMFPIAMKAAEGMALDPRGFAIGVTIAASASFLSPLGYQTNTMVYGPGGYHFGDYARLGIPLNLLVIVVCVLLIPIFWPL